MDREPAVANGIAAVAAAALIALAVAFGLPLTGEQQTALVGLVAVLAPIVAAILTRRKVTPLASPQAADGTPLVTAPNT